MLIFARLTSVLSSVARGTAGNGMLDEEELLQAVSVASGGARGFEVGARDIRLLFQSLDDDGDGVLSPQQSPLADCPRPIVLHGPQPKESHGHEFHSDSHTLGPPGDAAWVPACPGRGRSVTTICVHQSGHRVPGVYILYTHQVEHVYVKQAHNMAKHAGSITCLVCIYIRTGASTYI